MSEPPARARSLEEQPQADLAVGALRRQQVAGERPRQERLVARRRPLDRDREAAQVGRRRPESRRGHLGVHRPAPADDAPTGPVPARGVGLEAGRRRLLVAARRHPEGAEHQLPGELGERLPGHVDQELLQHAVAAAGVAELQPRHGRHPDRRRVAVPVEDVRKRRHDLLRAVAREAVHRQPGGVRQELAQRDSRLPARRRRDPPGAQPLVDVRVQLELAPGDQAQRALRRDRLRDRPGQEAGLRGHRVAARRRRARRPRRSRRGRRRGSARRSRREPRSAASSRPAAPRPTAPPSAAPGRGSTRAPRRSTARASRPRAYPARSARDRHPALVTRRPGRLGDLPSTAAERPRRARPARPGSREWPAPRAC